MARRLCFLCNKACKSSSTRRSSRNKQQLAVLLALLVHLEEVDAERSVQVFHTCSQASGGKYLCESHYVHAATLLVKEITEGSTSAEGLQQRLDSFLQCGTSYVFPRELFSHLQNYVQLMDESMVLDAKDVSRYLNDAIPRYGLNTLMGSVCVLASQERKKEDEDEGMATHKCVICGVGKRNALMRATWKNRSQLALFLSVLMHSDNLDLEKARSIYSASIERKSGKVFCHEHARNAASFLLNEAKAGLVDPSQLKEHLRVALDITIPRGVNVVPVELLQRLQCCVKQLDNQTNIVMLNIVHFIIESSSRYGLNSILDEMDEEATVEAQKRKGDFDNGEVIVKSIRLAEDSDWIINADAEQSNPLFPNSAKSEHTEGNLEAVLSAAVGSDWTHTNEVVPSTSQDASQLLSQFIPSAESVENITQIKEEYPEDLSETSLSASGMSRWIPVGGTMQLPLHGSDSSTNSPQIKQECPDSVLQPVSEVHRSSIAVSQRATVEDSAQVTSPNTGLLENISSMKQQCSKAVLVGRSKGITQNRPSSSLRQPSTSKCNREMCEDSGGAKEDQLKELFQFCSNCGSGIVYGGSSYSVRTVEMVPVVSICCSNCRNPEASASSLKRDNIVCPNAPTNDQGVSMAIAAATTGVRVSSLLRFSREAKVPFLSNSTFHNVFEKLRPSIERVYKKHQLATFEVVKSAYEADGIQEGWDIYVAFSCDSWKFCAGICKVLAVDLKTKLCLHSEVMHVARSGSERERIKQEGFRFLLYWFADRGLRIRSVCTDGTQSLVRVIADLNKELSWKMVWHLDPRRFAQRICRKVQKLSRRRGFGVVKGWIKPLRSHVTYAARVGYATGDVNNIKFIFNTFLNHVAGIHKWEKDGSTGDLTECDHGNIEYDGLETIPLCSVLHQNLKRILLQNSFQKSLCRLCPFGGDSHSETRNALDHMYCPKDIYLSPETYSAYLSLSSLHLNTLILAEIREEEDADSRCLKRKQNGDANCTSHKSRVAHSWRQDIREDYFAARQVDVNQCVSAAVEISSYVPDQFDSDVEEMYPDVPQFSLETDFINDALEHDSDDCDIDLEDI